MRRLSLDGPPLFRHGFQVEVGSEADRDLDGIQYSVAVAVLTFVCCAGSAPQSKIESLIMEESNMRKLSLDEVLDAVGEHTFNNEGYVRAHCPAHDDRTPSLSIWRDKKGVHVKCHAGCKPEAIFRAIRKLLKSRVSTRHRSAKKHEEAVYKYYKADGSLNFEVVRYTDKSFLQRRRSASGKVVWNMKGVKRTLYLLPKLLKVAPSELVFVVEGEKDADRLTCLGLAATTSSGGARNWDQTDSTPLYGRDVVIIPDNDEAGRAHARQVAQSLHGRASRIRILDLPGLEEGGDVSDWLDAGGTAEKLKNLADECADYVPAQLDEYKQTFMRILDPKAPYEIAGALVEDIYAQDRFQIIRYFCGQFYIWSNNHYAVLERAALRKQLYAYLNKTGAIHGENKILPFKPDKGKVDKLIDALAALIHLDPDCSPPFWIEEPSIPTNPRALLVMRSEILNLDSLEVMALTPKLFAVNALSFDYDPHSNEPTIWLKFLGQLWSDDTESIALVQEWFGYVLTPDTSLQKILLIVGPPRAGKGTIANILRELLGNHNVAGPTLASFSQNFGLQTLLDKPLAIVPDARLTGRADQGLIVERLLSISGEDALTVDRKYREPITVKLPTRIVIITNDMPRLVDASMALVRRFVLLKLTKTFLGKEDPQLLRKLIPELPGILTWAITGRKRLYARGHFIQPDSAQEELLDIERQSSPVYAFVEDECELDPSGSVSVQDLFMRWTFWCEANGHHAGSKSIFGKHLRAACPEITMSNVRSGESRRREYRGIRLRDRIMLTPS